MSINELQDLLYKEDSVSMEIRKCLSLYNSNGGCSFNGGVKCENCGSIPLMLKLAGQKVDHSTLKELLETNRLLKKLNN